MSKRALLIPVAVIVAGVAVLGFVNIYLARWAARALPVPVEGETVFVIRPGATLAAVARTLAEAELADPTWFSMRARQRNLASSLRHGEYRVYAGDTPDRLLDRLVSGDVVRHRFRLPEGATVADVIDRLAVDDRLAFDLEGATPANLMASLRLGDGHAEGWFFPDTYLFERDDKATVLLRRAHARMQQVLAACWADRDPSVQYVDQRQALVMASIVEKETGRMADRPRIAGVFLRRMRLNMRLQSDPTVIYGLGAAFDGNLRRSHLGDESPYNTYRYDGLPPTPIALPGRASIEAALHPTPGDALYFVARGDGTSEFSADLEQHNAAVRRYQVIDAQ